MRPRTIRIRNKARKLVSPFLWGMAMLYFASCANTGLEKSEHARVSAGLNNTGDTLGFRSGIRSIFQDSKGNYWFGSDQEGVCKYDGKTFRYYTTEHGFCGKQVISIQEDESGRIWFGTSSGLCSYDGNTFTSVRDDFPANPLAHVQQAAWSVNRTDIWFPGKNPHELIRIDHGEIQHLNYPIQFPSRGQPVDYGITGFSKSKSGGLWIAHYAGVTYYDGTGIHWINDSSLHYDGHSKTMHVRSILEDSKGRLWIGNNGIGVQLKEKDSVLHFSERFKAFKDIPFRQKATKGMLMHVFAICEDAKGNIWFGDRDTGVWCYDGQRLSSSDLDSTLQTQHVWCIYQDRQANLLFASADRGVYTFTGKGFKRVF